MRGFTWCKYVADDATEWALLVDSDYAEHPERGWVPAAGGELLPFPRGWLARRVLGIDSSGRTQSAIVATVTADLWTGATVAFSVETSDGDTATCRVTRRLQERSRMRP